MNVIDRGWSLVPMPDESCLDKICDAAHHTDPDAGETLLDQVVSVLGGCA